jgi:hypothetical protein
LLVLSAAAAAASCKQTELRAPEVAAVAAPAPTPLPVSPSAPLAPAPPPASWAVPPLGITTPMAGEPGTLALGAARLVEESCGQNRKDVDDLTKRRVEEMRAAVEANFAEWKSATTCDSGGLGLAGIGEGGGGFGSGIALGSIGTIGHGAGVGVQHATHATGTNNQVEGVDEADIVKNDGRYVYIVSRGALRIVEALHPRLLSVTRLPGDARDLVIDGDRAVVFVAVGDRAPACTYSYDCTVRGDGSQTRLVVLDVADRANPHVTRRIDLSGSLIAARRIGHAVHAVVADGDSPEPEYETWPETVEWECRPDRTVITAPVRAKFTKLENDNERKIRAASPRFPTISEHGVSRPICDAMHAPLGDGKAFTSVISFDIRDDREPATIASVETRPGVVFASADALYFATRHQKLQGSSRWYPFYENKDEVSDIHKFHIGSTPSATRYVGSGVVPGHVLNQFAMDEWYGYLRVATTTGRVPNPEANSSVSVLAEADGGTLVRIGAIEHIAPGEDIRAVRFDADRGYIVTFKKTDPLFVVSLAQPAAPSVLGELKIPGFSTYLHRIDPTHLLSIGFDAVDHGSFAYFDGIILQLFDVKDPVEPILLHKEKLGTRGSSSLAATDHLAFNYDGERNLLAIPLTLCEGGGDGRFGDTLAFSGLLLFDVTAEAGFRRLGGVDHGGRGASCSTWWSNATSQVKRSIFMDDLVFSIADDRMKVQRMSKLGEDVGNIALLP